MKIKGRARLPFYDRDPRLVGPDLLAGILISPPSRIYWTEFQPKR